MTTTSPSSELLLVRQPISACFDERGRMWVVEYLQYPTPAGLKSVTVDQYLRTKYDKVPAELKTALAA